MSNIANTEPSEDAVTGPPQSGVEAEAAPAEKAEAQASAAGPAGGAEDHPGAGLAGGSGAGDPQRSVVDLGETAHVAPAPALGASPATASTASARPPESRSAKDNSAFALLGPAATEAASLLVSELGLDAQVGDGIDLWGPDGAILASILSNGTKAWSAPLMSSAGTCGELALALLPGLPVLGEGRLASALAATVPALANACPAKHLGKLAHQNAQALREARPGQQALALPLLSKGERAGLFIVMVPSAQPAAELPHLDPAPGPQATARSIAALADVEMSVSVELGRTKIAIRDLLGIHNGAVVQLDRTVSQPVDVFVNGTLIARGEVVVVDECFAVRVTELLTGD
ncbi:MAG: flagellar motor switch protein FliN [Acidimicrobiales bacterium]